MGEDEHRDDCHVDEIVVEVGPGLVGVEFVCSCGKAASLGRDEPLTDEELGKMIREVAGLASAPAVRVKLAYPSEPEQVH